MNCLAMLTETVVFTEDLVALGALMLEGFMSFQDWTAIFPVRPDRI
jgi:hypothetical protein